MILVENNMNIIIEKFSQDTILKLDKDRFNSNNHGNRPDDYDYIIAQNKTSHWIDMFLPQYEMIILDEEDIDWLKVANIICSQTGKFSHIFDDNMEKTLLKFKDVKIDNVHIRTESVSLKYGVHGLGPYNSIKEILESLTSSINGHCPLKRIDKELKIYLIPWQNIDVNKEFRIFVYQNKITAISQQDIYTVNKLANDNLINGWVKIIQTYFNNFIKDKFIHIGNYSIDFAILENDIPYFIEINSFGSQYAAGSSLFHWIIDNDILYGDGTTIYFRWTCK
jgi:hypothetical protein